jgi:hypothetical protein
VPAVHLSCFPSVDSLLRLEALSSTHPCSFPSNREGAKRRGGRFFADFSRVSDEQAITILRESCANAVGERIGKTRSTLGCISDRAYAGLPHHGFPHSPGHIQKRRCNKKSSYSANNFITHLISSKRSMRVVILL